VALVATATVLTLPPEERRAQRSTRIGLEQVAAARVALRCVMATMALARVAALLAVCEDGRTERRARAHSEE
jgi:hypothetical protein